MSKLRREEDLLWESSGGTFALVFVGLLCVMSFALGGLMIASAVVRHMATSYHAIFLAIGLPMVALGVVFSQFTWETRVEISRTARTMVTRSRRVSLQRCRTEVSLAELDHVGITYRTGGGLRQAQAFWYIDLVMADNKHITVARRVRNASTTKLPEHVRADAHGVADFLGVKLVA